MSEGRVLHLRCFLEGVEIPVTSCSVTAQTGSAATAHIEILDDESAFELLPRTIVHVFFYDNQNGTNPSPPTYTLGSFTNSSSYKLLFCGEVFSVFHSKSGFGSRSLSLMALDMSNILDTNYVFQVSYTDANGLLETGGQAEAAFLAGQTVGNNPFDNIINSPAMVIQHLANKPPKSPHHALRVSQIGGLFSILELLLGVDRYAMGMNVWVTIHEKMTRLLDMIDSDTGKTAQNLFNASVFEEWIQGHIGSESPSMSFRQVLDMVMHYIYYRFTPIPTASYRKLSTSGTGREKPEVQDTPAAAGQLPEELKDYFASAEDFRIGGGINSELLKLAVDVVKELRATGYPTTVITDGYRTAADNERLGYVSAHGRGEAVDIAAGVWTEPLPEYPSSTYDSLFTGRIGNNTPTASLTNVRTMSVSSDNPYTQEAIDWAISSKYLSSRSTTTKLVASDGRIMKFFLERPPLRSPFFEFFSELAYNMEELLFDNVVINSFQFLNWIMVYPLMPHYAGGAPCRQYWIDLQQNNKLISTWKSGFANKTFMDDLVFDGNNPNALLYDMPKNTPAMVWLMRWIEKYEDYFTKRILWTYGNTVASSVKYTSVTYDDGASTPIKAYEYKINDGTAGTPSPKYAGLGQTSRNKYFTGWNQEGPLTPAQAKQIIETNSTPNVNYANAVIPTKAMGIIIKESSKKMGRLWHTFYEKKKNFWLAYDKTAKQKNVSYGLSLLYGTSEKVLRDPTLSPKIYDIIGISGDDPVHVQIRSGNSASGSNTPVFSEESGIKTEEEARRAYEERERLVGFLSTPDIWMCAPPVCNVIFPEEVVSLSVTRELMRQTSRLFLMSYDKLIADNVLLNSHYFAPQFKEVDSIKQTSFGGNTGHEIVYPHEKYSGIIPKVNRMSEVSFYARARSDEEVSKTELSEADIKDLENKSADQQTSTIAQKATAGIASSIVAYATNVAHFDLLKQRYSATRISATCKFLGRVVPGLPGAIIGKQSSKNHTDLVDTQTWLGTIEAISHSYSQAGATTSLTFTTCRPYNTGPDSIDELARLKEPGSILFNNQDPDAIKSVDNVAEGGSPLLSFYNGAYASNYPAEYDPSDVYYLATRVLEAFHSASATKYTFGLTKSDKIFIAPQGLSRSDITSLANNAAQLINSIEDKTIGLLSSWSLDANPEIVNYPPGSGPRETNNPKIWSAAGKYTYDSSTNIDYVVVSEYFYTPKTTLTGEVTLYVADLFDLRSTYNGFLFGIEPTPEIQTSFQESIDGAADSINATIGNNPSVLIERDGQFKVISGVSARSPGAPVLGYFVSSVPYVYEDFVTNGKLTSPPSEYIEVEGTQITDASMGSASLAIKVSVTPNAVVVKVPIILHSPEFTLALSEAVVEDAADSSGDKKYIPLEEALLPPWVDSSYKNGTVGPRGVVTKSSGIGALYRRWFSCDSIIDGVPYKEDSIYYTVTIEEAMDNIIRKYESGKNDDLKNVYKWANRDIANLGEMLASPKNTESKSVDVFQTGGFHATAVGNYAGLEGLGLLGVDLRSNVLQTSTIQLPNTVVTLDPRADRQKRVKVYRNKVTSTRGRTG